MNAALYVIYAAIMRSGAEWIVGIQSTFLASSKGLATKWMLFLRTEVRPGAVSITQFGRFVVNNVSNFFRLPVLFIWVHSKRVPLPKKKSSSHSV